MFAIRIVCYCKGALTLSRHSTRLLEILHKTKRAHSLAPFFCLLFRAILDLCDTNLIPLKFGHLLREPHSNLPPH